MQNIFPYIGEVSQIAPFLIRTTMGIYLFYFGYKHITLEWMRVCSFFTKIHLKPHTLFAYVFCIGELLSGTMLLMGILTQMISFIWTILFMCIIIIDFYEENKLKERDCFLLLLLVCLFFLGSGYFGFDLQLKGI